VPHAAVRAPKSASALMQVWPTAASPKSTACALPATIVSARAWSASSWRSASGLSRSSAAAPNVGARQPGSDAAAWPKMAS